jgi:hypothetical protein
MNWKVYRMNAGRGRYNQRLAPAGTPDILAISPTGRCLWIEVKAGNGSLRSRQVIEAHELRKRNHEVIKATCVEAVEKVLRSGVAE